MNHKATHYQDSHYIHGSSQDEQRRLSQLNEHLNSLCLHQLQLQGSERILDVGSGLGQFTLEMAQQVGEQGYVLGIERDYAQLAEAEDRLTAAGDTYSVEFRKGDAYKLPLHADEWGSFDLVFTRFLLEHLADPAAAVAQMVKTVRPGGRVVLVDDDHESFHLWPEPPGFSLLWGAYTGLYKIKNNDPFVGRRLVSLLYEAGVRKIHNTSLFFGGAAGTEGFDSVSENLIEAFHGVKDELLSEALLTDSCYIDGIEALRHWQKDPSAALWYNLCWAEGTLP